MSATISNLRAREILDSGGRPTVEVELELSDGTQARASVPSGTSTGRHEAHELRDRDVKHFGGQGVLTAVENVRGTLAPALRGRDPSDQSGLDALLIELDGTPDKSRLGANALLPVSIAAARAAAISERIPLFRRLGGGTELPLPMVNIISGGLHADSGLAYQDFLILPVGARSFREALEIASDVRSATGRLLTARGFSTLKAAEGGFGPPLENAEHALDLLVEAVGRSGHRLGDEVVFGLDIAATHFFSGGSYHPAGVEPGLEAAQLVESLAGLAAAYPIVSLEDGLAEDDWEGWSALTARLGDSLQLLGDDLFTTNAVRLGRGIAQGVANAVLVKMNQIGTLTETLNVVEQARRAGYAPVISARSGETGDDFISDLAVGSGAGQIKIGSLAQSERLAKYNQLLRIEEQLGSEATFAGRAALTPRT